MTDQEPPVEATRADNPVVDEPTQAMVAPVDGGPPGEPPIDDGGDDGGGDDGAPDRRRWIIVGLVVAVVLVGLAAWLLAGDDDGDRDDDPATTTTTTTEPTTTTTDGTTTTTAAPTTTTTTTAPTTTTTATPTTIDPARCVSSAPDDPETTALVVYDAYTVGDRGCAGNLATSEAVDDLFAIPGGGGGWTFAGCVAQQDPSPHTLCSFTFPGGSTGFRMAYTDAEGWTVYEVLQTAD